MNSNSTAAQIPSTHVLVFPKRSPISVNTRTSSWSDAIARRHAARLSERRRYDDSARVFCVGLNYKKKTGLLMLQAGIWRGARETAPSVEDYAVLWVSVNSNSKRTCRKGVKMVNGTQKILAHSTPSVKFVRSRFTAAQSCHQLHVVLSTQSCHQLHVVLSIATHR